MSSRNALDCMPLRQASRLYADRDRVLSEAELTPLNPADILVGGLFSAGPN